MTCPRCKNENPTDYPVCGPCSQTAHRTHRFCLCLECKRERDLAWFATTRRNIVAAHTHLMTLYALSLAFGDEPATLADMADDYKLPSHGDTRNETIVREHKNGGYHSYTQCEKYCAQCGWLTLRGIFGGLAWVAEHEGHESKRNQLPLAA